jgi:hypothetical protein
MKVAIRRIGLSSLAKFGCLLGVVAALLPSLLCGLLILGLAGIARRWLEGWEEIHISILGQEIASLDLISYLGLERVMHVLQVLGAASTPVLILAVLAMALVSGALLAIIIALVGLVYNLLASATGGLVVDMSAIDQNPGSR